MEWFDFFTHPFLRAPTWGSLFMCVAASLMGVPFVLRRQTLLGEVVSHAAYPGILFVLFFTALWMPTLAEFPLFFAVLLGALCSSFFALRLLRWLEIRAHVTRDAALSFVLVLFFGLGLVAVSVIQGYFPSRYKEALNLLFGQSATMHDGYIWIYGGLLVIVSIFLILCYRPLQALILDRSFAKSSGVRVEWVEGMLYLLFLSAIVIGLKSVGIVLMSGMIVAPTVAARQWTDRLVWVFSLSALFGAVSAVLGTICSIEYSLFLSHKMPMARATCPSGPMIVLIGTLLALVSLLLAPRQGLLFRMGRLFRFRVRCVEENILKAAWREGKLSPKGLNALPFGVKRWLLFRMRRAGWIVWSEGSYALTVDGFHKAASIVRLHRLWELYLSEEMGCRVDTVHRHAEEMEHILTPALEERLTQLLANPTIDPHAQPIPERFSSS